MPARVEIRGTDEFRRTAAKLKAAGNGQLSKRMAKEMRAAAQPAVRDAQTAVKAIKSASTRGGGGQQRREYALSRKRKRTERAKKAAFEGRGLRSSVARAVGTQVRSGGRSASVRIRVNSRQLPPDQQQLPGYMNTGSWRHPVFGNRNTWVAQTARPKEWFDRPMRKHGVRIRRRAVQVVGDIKREITS
ncbi:hypothetical protein [Prauserella flavalba]|uniref:hypothetical protein n=1 Tax=Prauserella flavalba TaxID=1477506 RepID=UPI0036E2AE7B